MRKRTMIPLPVYKTTPGCLRKNQWRLIDPAALSPWNVMSWGVRQLKGFVIGEGESAPKMQVQELVLVENLEVRIPSHNQDREALSSYLHRKREIWWSRRPLEAGLPNWISYGPKKALLKNTRRYCMKLQNSRTLILMFFCSIFPATAGPLHMMAGYVGLYTLE